MKKWFIDVLRYQYADFSGRANREKYWMFVLWYFLLAILVSFLGQDILSHLVSLALLVPSLAIGVRRLHDLDKSGWWMLLVLIPLLGALILLVLFVMKGTTGPNRFGMDPLAQSEPEVVPKGEATVPQPDSAVPQPETGSKSDSNPSA